MGVPQKSRCRKHENCSDPSSAEPICPFPRPPGHSAGQSHHTLGVAPSKDISEFAATPMSSHQEDAAAGLKKSRENSIQARARILRCANSYNSKGASKQSSKHQLA